MSNLQIVKQPYPQGVFFVGPPPCVSIEQAIAPCDCLAAIGFRLDRDEPAILVVPCCERHYAWLEQIKDLYAKSLEDPTDRPAFDVLVEIFRLNIARRPGALRVEGKHRGASGVALPARGGKPED